MSKDFVNEVYKTINPNYIINWRTRIMSKVYGQVAGRVNVEGLVRMSINDLNITEEQAKEVKEVVKGICDNMLWHDNITDDNSYSPILMEYMQAAMIVGMATKDEIMAERNTVHKLEADELVEDVN